MLLLSVSVISFSFFCVLYLDPAGPRYLDEKED